MEPKKIGSYGTFGLHIIQFPSGRYGFVGTIPAELVIDAPRSFDSMEAAEAFANEKLNKPA